MQHEWMIRVLEDLQAYARLHGLTALAGHLDQARLLALTEIASLPPHSTDTVQAQDMGQAHPDTLSDPPDG